MFAFNVGCFERAWTFNAAACRVYESLPLSDSSEAIPVGQSDTKHAFELCYLLDKTLSQTMDRAPSLTPGRISEPTVPQDSISPVYGLYKLFSDVAEVQDAVVRALRRPKNSHSHSEQVENLERTVHGLRGDLERVKKSALAKYPSLTLNCSVVVFAKPTASGPARLRQRRTLRLPL